MRRPSPRRERRRWEWRANPVELWVKSPIARWRSVCTGARVRRVVRWRGGCICRNPGWKRRRGGQRARSPRAPVTGAKTTWPWIWGVRGWGGGGAAVSAGILVGNAGEGGRGQDPRGHRLLGQEPAGPGFGGSGVGVGGAAD